MKKSVEQRLFELNSRFYQEYGTPFAETRRRIQPGVRRILDECVHDGDWLDLGCGSGALGAVWVEKGLSGLYEGLDFSPVLIETAQQTLNRLEIPTNLRIQYTVADFNDDQWTSSCSQTRYTGVLMFAALHHIPGAETRLRLLQQIAKLLPENGLFVHSEWQFNRSPRLLARVLPWSAASLQEDDLEPGDTLLDWRHYAPQPQESEPGLRYVHLFSNEELLTLADNSGFKIEREFSSDGATGDLSLYQVWQRN